MSCKAKGKDCPPALCIFKSHFNPSWTLMSFQSIIDYASSKVISIHHGLCDSGLRIAPLHADAKMPESFQVRHHGTFVIIITLPRQRTSCPILQHLLCIASKLRVPIKLCCAPVFDFISEIVSRPASLISHSIPFLRIASFNTTADQPK
jgi:hypothetical protein